MPQLIRFLPVFLLGVFLLGCATQKKTTTSDGTQYTEDLSIWRPKVEPVLPTERTVEDSKKQKAVAEPKYTVNRKLDAVLDSIDRINLRRNFIDGFTIQVYSGLKREDALNAKKQLTSSLPELESEINYLQPNFRVKVGKYFSRIDAQKDYVAVKEYFPNAIVIPDKVAIN
ncbi:MAG: DUF1801 domain-containing protein [Cyclobacteriaceae bacterium]|nr:DUF1801 domain-containing protein [Cyclobacteriaceae bacterium]MDH4296492.1 DUF1801 domain-containing protein [Cyclobacteriaceae bacterium]MDH5250491.1 DUF1801 domain-containing protein [Cyclobacteriaceae bacterium]